ncbi:laminin subunit gamma-1-like isoform X2 [Symsagittifera roscoffensis]|uniref:laminin subunit gamma-1-like isoform X2 n=1 Tax=Symsagittifera roscoffensis TaxID=84072 RepID=UPI00307CBE65
METKQIQLFLLGIFLICRRANANSCYIGTVSYACEPETVSLASGVKVSATSTCGISGEKNFLEAVTRGTDEFRNVDCNQFDTSGSLIYDPKNSVDGTSRTHWKSATIFDMNSKSADLRKDRNEMVVNLTVDLGIISEIDRISITFESPRPYSMVIYSKVSFDDEWNAVRFYSVGCMEEFQMDPWYGGVSSGQKCDQSQSGFSPQSGGTVDFSRGQTKIEARYIRLAMLRIHTPRSTSDLLRDNPMYLKSFYYAISDITVRGRCMCNGHANECDLTDPKNKVCVCQHNTDGANCQDCLRFHHNKPWKSLKLGETRFECERCDCNGRSSDCVFKNDVYQRNGFRNGGVCLKCQNSTAGQNCEKCLPEHFSTRDGKCNPCNCNKEGSSDMQCDSKGMCNCKPGITGPLCDQCLPGFYGFGSTEGCTKCECDLKGTRASRMTCNPIDGSCPCKANVEGKSCENCKYGYFDLSAENDEGCRACFCYDHSKNCSEANKILNVDNIQSDLSKIDQQYGLNIGGWRAMTLLGSQCRMVLRGTSSSSSSMTTEKSLSIDSSFSNAASDCALKSTPETFVYFEVPKQFVGNRISSYGLKLSFELKPIGSFSEVMTSYRDVIVEGFVGKKVVRVMAGLYWQRNTPLRARQWNKFEFTLTETEAWQPALSPVDFQSMLLNVNSILIRGAYGDISCDLKNVALEYATEEYSFTSAQKVASEICQCPEAYSGTHCQDCAPGYRRLNVELGQLSECVKCNCNSHASDCDPLTGDCNCEHNTIGAQCDQCKPGFFGLPSKDPSEFACEPCPCSIVSDPTTGLLRNGKCEQKREDVVCVECPQGYTGPKCDVCKRGFYQRSGKCIKCDCNGNVDESSVQSYCDQLKGKCNQCTNNTMGDHCEKCVSDHYGSASDNPSSCTPCNCLPQGSSRDYSEVGVAGRQSCSPYTGACVCRPYVVGRRCDTCVEGYYGVLSGQGCSPCDCDPHGSKSPSCDVISGQCTCLPNVVGRKCDQCASGTFGLQSISNTTTAAPPEASEVVPGFSGCEKCECDPKGIEYSVMSKDSGREMTVACDEMGNCGACRDNVTGQKCDRCVENHYKETFADFETDFYACKRCVEA